MITRTIKVLFVCSHNSARSQMAEGLLNHYCDDIAVAQSAGLDPGILNPMAARVMKEIDIDISDHEPKNVMELFKTGEKFDRVISTCDQTASERAPLYPGLTVRLDWSFPDPAEFQGSEEEILGQFRELRDEIKEAILEWHQEEISQAQARETAHA